MIRLIWAQDRNGVIGVANGLPWRIPEDSRRFRALTAGHTVLMGRRTWESLPASFRPLPARENWVLTRRPTWADEGAIRAGSVTQVIEGTDGRDLWVAGGGQVYALTLPLADECLVTEIDAEVSGDTMAPQLPLEAWRQDEAHPEASDWQCSAAGARFRYVVHRRHRP